jgi:hypothetical protein
MLRGDQTVRKSPRLDIFPMWIGVTTAKGTERVATDPAAWERVVAGGFAEIEPVVRELVQRTGIRGSKVEVVVETKGGSVELLTLPVGYQESVTASEMRLRDGLGTTDILSAAARVGGEGAGGKGPTTLLIAGETTARIESLDHVLRSAGVIPFRVVAARAHAMVSAVAQVGAMLPARAAAVLWIGPSGTVLAGGAGAACTFARTLGAGYDALIDAVQRAASECTGIDAAASADALGTHGIPTRGSMMGEGLPGDWVLPILQPVLQRLGIEIKQTLRFGLPEGEANRVEVVLAGEGSTIPRLATVLSALIETSTSVAEAASDDRAADLWFIPPARARAASKRRLVSAAALGLAAAGVAIGGDAWWSIRELASVRAEVRENVELLEQTEHDRADHERLASLTHELGRLDALAKGTLGPKPSWAAALAMLTQLGVSGMQIHEITGAGGGEEPTLTIKGLLPATGEGDGSMLTVLHRLRGSPLAVQVRPGSTRLVESEDGRALYFTATVTLGTLDARTRLSLSPSDGGAR